MDAVLAHYFEMNRPKEYARIFDECLHDLGIEPGTTVPPDKQSELNQLVSSRLTLYESGLAYEEKLSPEEAGRVLAKK